MKTLKIDLSTVEDSITSQVESLISKMILMSESEIKDEFTRILYSYQTSISDNTRFKWMQIIDKSKGKLSIMKIITNLYLAGCKLNLK